VFGRPMSGCARRRGVSLCRVDASGAGEAVGSPCGQSFPGPRCGNNGFIDAPPPTPGTSRRLSDALIRLQIRAQNNPRRAGRVAGVAFALLLFLAMALGSLFAFDDHPLYLVITLALLGAVLGGALLTVMVSALAHRSLGGRLIPAETDPADVRAARRALGSGRLSGTPRVDLIARALAAQALRHRMRPWVAVLLGALPGGSSLLNAWSLYHSHGGWSGMSVTALVLGMVMLVGTAVDVPVARRSTRRTRAFVEAYDARGEDGRPRSPGPPRKVPEGPCDRLGLVTGVPGKASA
jgi:hypothetical protein